MVKQVKVDTVCGVDTKKKVSISAAMVFTPEHPNGIPVPLENLKVVLKGS